MSNAIATPTVPQPGLLPACETLSDGPVQLNIERWRDRITIRAHSVFGPRIALDLDADAAARLAIALLRHSALLVNEQVDVIAAAREAKKWLAVYDEGTDEDNLVDAVTRLRFEVLPLLKRAFALPGVSP